MSPRTLDDLDEAVAEYLEHYQFSNTLECFHSEIRHRKLRRDRLAKSSKSEDAELKRSNPARTDDKATTVRRDGRSSATRIALFKAFDKGKMPQLIAAWSALIPKALQRRDASSPLAREARVVEFLTCVHCAILPFRAQSPTKATGPREAGAACAKAMASFVRYLDGRASTLAQERDLVQFFALPRVPDPPSHPTFEGLFQADWLVDLRARVNTLLEKVEGWRPEEPLLVKLLLRGVQNPMAAPADESAGRQRETSITITTENRANVVSSCDEAPDRTRDGTPAAGQSRRGTPVPSVDGEVMARWEGGGDGEGSVASRRDSAEGSPPEAVATSASAEPPDRRGSNATQQGHQPQHLQRSDTDRAILGRVNYHAIKRDIRRLAEEVAAGSLTMVARASAAVDAALLLQTIRWRFTHAPPGKTRRGVLYHLIRQDIFDLRPSAVAGDKRDGGLRGDSETGDRQPACSLLELLLSLGASSSPVSKAGENDEFKEAKDVPDQKQHPSEDDDDDDREEGHRRDEQDRALREEDPGQVHESIHSPERPPHKGSFSAVQAKRDALRRGRSWEGSSRDAHWSKASKQGWEEFDGEPGRLLAEYAARLLGALATMSKARSYVLGQDSAGTIGTLASTLRAEGFRETGLAERLLEVLARLSARRSARESIAFSGFVDWAAKMFGSSSSHDAAPREPSVGFVRYTTKILGNVFVTVSGRVAAVAATPDLVGSLANLLEHEDAQVRSNAIRALRLLLEAREAKERALETGMDALLQDLRSRSSHDSSIVEGVESLLEQLDSGANADTGGDSGSDRDAQRLRDTQQGRQEASHLQPDDSVEEEDMEDAESLLDEEPEAIIVSYFVNATNAPHGEELLRQRYLLSTADAKEQACSLGDAWGGDEEELVCGVSSRGKRGGGESKEEIGVLRKATPEAGTATVIGGEEKIYDSHRPGVPEAMQSRPRIPRTPAVGFRTQPLQEAVGATQR